MDDMFHGRMEMDKEENNGSRIILKQLSINDGIDVYDMLQHIGEEENEFTNMVNGMSFEEFKRWLVKQDNWSKGIELEEGYVVQTTYWLYDDNIPVGYGKIRDELTPASRERGGNIGYAIDSRYRGRGYGTVLMRELIEMAKSRNIKERLATVQKYNYPSKHVIEKCGGRLLYENDMRWYLEI